MSDPSLKNVPLYKLDAHTWCVEDFWSYFGESLPKKVAVFRDTDYEDHYHTSMNYDNIEDALKALDDEQLLQCQYCNMIKYGVRFI